MGHHRRFRSNFLQAEDLLTKGLIGRLTRIEAEEGSISDWPRSAAYFDPVLAGGGALLDVGVHCVDLVRWLAGEFAQVRYSGNQTASAVESEAQLDFELENGVQGSILSSRDRKLRNEVRLIGTEGAITVGLWEMDLLLQRCIGKAFRHFPSLQLCPVRRALDSSFVDLLAHFVTAIRTGTQAGCEWNGRVKSGGGSPMGLPRCPALGRVGRSESGIWGILRT